MLNKFCEVILQGCDLDGNLKPGTHTYPAYTCGHCTSIIIMRSNRERPRNLCMHCMKWICEKNQICNTQCTPMHSMAKDHFEGAGAHGKYVDALMQGVTEVAEAEKLGLIKEI